MRSDKPGFVEANIVVLRNFLRDVGYRILARSIVNLRGLILLPIIAKNLGAEHYGIYSQIVITITFLVPIFLLGFRESFTRSFASRPSGGEVSAVFLAMLGIVWGSIGLVAIPALLFEEQASFIMFGGKQYGLYIRIFLLYLFIVGGFTFTLNYYRTMNRIGKYSLIESIVVISEICILIAIIMGWKINLVRVLIVMISVESIAVIYMMFDIQRTTSLRFAQMPALLPYLRFGLPLIISDTMWWIVDSSDRYMTTHYLGIEATGIYSAAYLMAKIVLFMTIPIHFVLFPTLSRYWDQDRKEEIQSFVQVLLKGFFLLAIPFSCLLFYASPFLIKKLCGNDFVTNSSVIGFLLAGFFAFSLSQIVHIFIYISRQTKYFFFILSFVAPLNLGLNLALIPILGIKAAALSKFFCFSIYAILVFFCSKRIHPFEVDLFFIGKIVLGSILMYFFLRFFDIGTALDIVWLSALGAGVYSVVLLACKAVHWHELQLIKSILGWK